MKKNKKLRNVIFNVVSAILIVFCWFVFYYFFGNYDKVFSQQLEGWNIRIEDTEWLNIEFFTVLYFLIELVNYRFTDLLFWNYALIQAILDFALFFVCLTFMEKTSWFAPITIIGLLEEHTEFRALLHYFQQYSFAFFVSYIGMFCIHQISMFVKKRKK